MWFNEIFNMIFRFLISFAVDILYETAIINKLFYFELSKTKIPLKKEIDKDINIYNIKNYEDKKSSSRYLDKIDGKENNKDNNNTLKAPNSKKKKV